MDAVADVLRNPGGELAREPLAASWVHQNARALQVSWAPEARGKNEMTFEDGRVRETREKPGEVIWREPGIPHELLNCSDWQYRNVLIEIKARAA